MLLFWNVQHNKNNECLLNLLFLQYTHNSHSYFASLKQFDFKLTIFQKNIYLLEEIYLFIEKCH